MLLMTVYAFFPASTDRTQVGTTTSPTTTPSPPTVLSSSQPPSNLLPLVPFITFDWDSYLKGSNSVPAPPEFFKQVRYIVML